MPLQPEVTAPQQPRKFTQKELMDAIITTGCKYLLFERENETLIRQALANLAQERHNEFHTKAGRKGDGSSFQDCKNDICKDVNELIKGYQKPAIEFTLLTAEMLDTKYELNILKGTNTCIVSLKDKNKVDAPPELPSDIQQGDQSKLMIKV